MGIPFLEISNDQNKTISTQRAGQWTDELSATEYSLKCPGLSRESDKKEVLSARVLENCLTLNIWTPALNPSKLFPIHFFIVEANSETDQRPVKEAGVGVASQERVLITLYTYSMTSDDYLRSGFTRPPSPWIDGGDYLLGYDAAINWIMANVEASGGDNENIEIRYSTNVF